MSYEFHKLQVVRCFDAVSVRVPGRWRCGPETDALWSCYEDGEDTGTLWISLDRIDTGGSDQDPSALARRTMDGLRERGDEHPGSEIAELAPGKLLWTRVFDETDDQGSIRNFWYMFVVADEGTVALVNFNLVLSDGTVDDPEFRALVDMMDREIRTANLYPFGLDATFMLPLQRRYFGGKLALELPNMMRRTPGDNPDGQTWLCYFPPELPARVIVEIRDQELADEESREPISIDPEHYDVFPEYAGLLPADRPYDLSRIADGVLVHSAHDLLDPQVAPSGEPDDSTPAWFAEPQRCHEWNCCRFTHGHVRTAIFFLFFPLRCVSESPLIALIEILNRAIPAVQFPDLDAANDRKTPGP